MKVNRTLKKFSEKIFKFHDNNLKQYYSTQTSYVSIHLIHLLLHQKIHI